MKRTRPGDSDGAVAQPGRTPPPPPRASCALAPDGAVLAFVPWAESVAVRRGANAPLGRRQTLPGDPACDAWVMLPPAGLALAAAGTIQLAATDRQRLTAVPGAAAAASALTAGLASNRLRNAAVVRVPATAPGTSFFHLRATVVGEKSPVGIPVCPGESFTDARHGPSLAELFAAAGPARPSPVALVLDTDVSVIGLQEIP